MIDAMFEPSTKAEIAMITAYGYSIPVFSGDFSPEDVQGALREFGRAVVVLDGASELGQQYIEAVRIEVKMDRRNLEQFGDDPFVFAFSEPTSGGGSIQYLVYSGGEAFSEVRRALASATVRQWYDAGMPRLYLTRLHSQYLNVREKELACMAKV